MHVQYINSEGVYFLLSQPQMIARRGYLVETHNVTTSDGYILKVFRMPRPGKKVVFLQHGVFSSAFTWVAMGPGNGPGKSSQYLHMPGFSNNIFSTAYLFWEAGFDVWMGNSRGNYYSKAHTKLKTTDSKFWSFS